MINANIGDIIKFEHPWNKLSWIGKILNKKRKFIIYRLFLKNPYYLVLNNNDKFIVTCIILNSLVIKPYNKKTFYEDIVIIKLLQQRSHISQKIDFLTGDYLLSDDNFKNFTIISDIIKNSRKLKLKKINNEL